MRRNKITLIRACLYFYRVQSKSTMQVSCIAGRLVSAIVVSFHGLSSLLFVLNFLSSQMMKVLILLFATIILASCSTLEGVKEKLPFMEKPPRALRYSDNPQLPSTGDRQYRRVTKARLEEESSLGSDAGSMWVMDGQTSYMFSQNKNRKEGDVLKVKLEGAAQKQVEAKVTVIKRLIKQLEEQARLEAARKSGAGEGPDGPRGPAAEKKPEPSPVDEKVDLSEIDMVPTRIVEKTPEGNYRLRGSSPFMIEKREYKVLVTGMIRPEDFNDEGVSASKLIDSQFDVVSLRKRGPADN